MAEARKSRDELVAELRSLQSQQASSDTPSGLEQVDARLHRVLENMQAVMVESGADGRNLYVSPSVAAVLGYAPEDFLRRESWEWIHEDDLPTLVAATLRMQETGEPVEMTFRTRHKAGHWVWLEATSSHLRTLEGEDRVVTFARDVSDMKRTGEALRRSEDRFRAIAENTADLLLEIDANGRFLYVSPNSAQILGVPPDRLIGHLMAEFIAMDVVHPDDRDAMISGFETTVATERRSGNREFRFRHSDGTWHWFENQFKTYNTPDGGWRAVVISRDVNERVLAQRNLEESEARYRVIAETAHEMITETDAEGRVVYMSAAAKTVLGYSPEETLGMTPEQIVHPDDLERCVAALTDGARRRVRVRPDPFRVIRKDGSVRWLEGQGIPFDRAEGAPRFLFVMRDITERREAEQARRDLEHQIEEAQRLEGLGVMAGGIAHDFNNLLTPILGDASLALIDLPAESPLRPRLLKIQKAAQRAAALTNQMLAYAGKGPVVLEPIDLTSLVREMAQLLESSVARRATLELDLDDSLPPVEGDGAQLSQVVMNLLTNASEAIGERGGHISIRTCIGELSRDLALHAPLDHRLGEQECVCFEVADDGCGMDAVTRSRIFDPFFTTKFTGRGLGLAAVIGIVRGHGGAIEIESEPGQGTRFRVLLPRARNAARPVADAAVDSDDWRASGTVLVIDDDTGVRELARDVLTRVGFTVLCASDPDEGLELFARRADEIRAVLLDRTMPEGSGEEVFDRIRSLRPEMPVVLTSGYSEERAAEWFAGRGLSGFLQKPFLPEALLAALRRALSDQAVGRSRPSHESIK